MSGNREQRRRRARTNGTAARPNLMAMPNGRAHQPEPPARPVFLVTPAGQVQQQDEDGTIFRIQMFQCLSPDGSLLCEQTPAGNVPVTIAALPIPVGKGIIVPGGPMPPLEKGPQS